MAELRPQQPTGWKSSQPQNSLVNSCLAAHSAVSEKVAAKLNVKAEQTFLLLLYHSSSDSALEGTAESAKQYNLHGGTLGHLCLKLVGQTGKGGPAQPPTSFFLISRLKTEQEIL